MIAGVLRLAAILLALMAWPSVVQAELARWNVDSEHSTIEFRVAHMPISNVLKQTLTCVGPLFQGSGLVSSVIPVHAV
jgi:polyisoprenoid-binding protein YceI